MTVFCGGFGEGVEEGSFHTRLRVKVILNLGFFFSLVSDNRIETCEVNKNLGEMVKKFIFKFILKYNKNIYFIL